eukprot:COSAG03_NODE_22888_length_285_cov_2.322581_2_plen_28_part_01
MNEIKYLSLPPSLPLSLARMRARARSLS